MNAFSCEDDNCTYCVATTPHPVVDLEVRLYNYTEELTGQQGYAPKRPRFDDETTAWSHANFSVTWAIISGPNGSAIIEFGGPLSVVNGTFTIQWPTTVGEVYTRATAASG